MPTPSQNSGRAGLKGAFACTTIAGCMLGAPIVVVASFVMMAATPGPA